MRVLIAFVLVACGTASPPAPPTTAAQAPSAAPTPERPKAIAIGEKSAQLGPLHSAKAREADVVLGTSGKPTILFFWSPSTKLARDEIVRFHDWLATSHVADRADVFAVAGTREGGMSSEAIVQMAVILGVEDMHLLTDPDFQLSSSLGVESSPEIAVLSADGSLLARSIRSLDHTGLRPEGASSAMNARDYLVAVADQKSGPTLKRTAQWYPSSALEGHQVPDVELPEFSPDGWGKGKTVRLRSLLSGKRPAAIVFFSSTCKHCQVDVPQIVKLMNEHPDTWDVIGITSIKSPQHRLISKTWFEQQHIEFPILEDEGSVNEIFQVISTPTTFYVAPNGTIGNISYYQHEDLASDWSKLAARLETLPRGDALAQTTGWSFPLSAMEESGKEIDLSSFAGHPAVVHFWATWCGPCREELPALVARIPEISKSAKVALISVEKDASVFAPFREKTNLTFPTLFEPHGGIADKIDFAPIPQTFVLDATGHVQDVLRGSYPWADDDKFARVLDHLH